MFTFKLSLLTYVFGSSPNFAASSYEQESYVISDYCKLITKAKLVVSSWYIIIYVFCHVET